MAKLPKWLFWWDSAVKEMIWGPWWWLITIVVIFVIPFLRVWWWFFVPIILADQLRTLYRWWIAWDFAYAKTKWVVLELVPPKENLAPMKAMEDVFAMIWPIYDTASWKDIWIDGELDNSPYWLSFEIVSIEGSIHFYARIMAEHRSVVESIIYTHFPEIEIREVPDYVKNVPQDIPNEEWDLYGEDFILSKSPAYPIKTYEKFFEPQGERISAEEKRIDPIVSLLESMSRLGPGEQYWAQFVCIPIADSDDPWKKEAKKLIEKHSRRPVKKEKTFLEDVAEMTYNLIMGPAKEGSGEKASYKWLSREKSDEGENELLLTPGEKEILLAIEDKIKKPVFKTNIRGIYIAKRENFKGINKTIMRSYVSHFKTEHLNYLIFSLATRVKIKHFMIKRRVYMRARKIFKNAVSRFTPLFPNRDGVLAILNTEEMASIFHFPIKITGLVSPTIARVESKKGGPPPNLPIE